MKILLDNCVPKRAKRLLPGHAVTHASEIGMEQLGNGQLIAACAAHGFEVLITTDKKMRFEQNLNLLPIPILELNTHLTRFVDLQSLQPFLETALDATRTCRFVSVAPSGAIEKFATVADDHA